MSAVTHVVCPHCHATNRVPSADLGAQAHCGKCQQSLFQAHALNLSEADFERHLHKSDLPLVVDFWAPWCGPCRAMAPHFEAAAAQLEPHVQLIKINTEEAQQLAARYQIRSIPTLAVFKGGRMVASQPGAMGQADLVRWVKANTPA